MTDTDPHPMTDTAEEVERGFDFVSHAEVQDLRAEGIWTDLGPKFGRLEVRLRPFHERAVVVRREAAEHAQRLQLGLAKNEELPGDAAIESNRAAVTMAVTGARGRVRCTPEMEAIARRNGWPLDTISEAVWVTLEGSETAAEVRALFDKMLKRSMRFLTLLARASKELNDVDDREIHRLGESFVYGRHVAVGWHD